MSGTRPRLVVVSAEIPAPQSTSGFAARLQHFLEAAQRQMDVTLALVGLDAATEPIDADALPADRTVQLPVASAAWRGGSASSRLLRVVVQYPLDPLPYHCYPRRLPALRRLLADSAPDVIVFYLPYLAQLVDHCPAGTPAIACLEEPWEWVVDAAIAPKGGRGAWLARRETARFRRLYRRVDTRLDAVVAISDAERAYFQRYMPQTAITVIPHGVDTHYFASGEAQARTVERDIDVLVVGLLSAAHNAAGALSVWNAARQDPAGANRRWAFVGPIESALAARLRAEGCLVPGQVDDVRPYYRRARCVLVPALVGRGVKTTSLQAWAMARPLVASPIGAQGLPAREGENVLIGADAAAMADHLTAVLADPALANRLAAGGRATVERERDLEVLAGSFAQVCLRVATDRRGP